MKVENLFIMVNIDMFIEIQLLGSECKSERDLICEVGDFLYDCLIEFNRFFNRNSNDIYKSFSSFVISKSLCTRYYKYCTKFRNMYDCKVKRLEKKGI